MHFIKILPRQGYRGTHPYDLTEADYLPVQIMGMRVGNIQNRMETIMKVRSLSKICPKCPFRESVVRVIWRMRAISSVRGRGFKLKFIAMAVVSP
jgi:hypothetical protein